MKQQPKLRVSEKTGGYEKRADKRQEGARSKLKLSGKGGQHWGEQWGAQVTRGRDSDQESRRGRSDRGR